MATKPTLEDLQELRRRFQEAGDDAAWHLVCALIDQQSRSYKLMNVAIRRARAAIRRDEKGGF